MLEYVEQITRDATKIQPEFHDRWRQGFDDRNPAITLIASWFNYINRVLTRWGWQGLGSTGF